MPHLLTNLIPAMHILIVDNEAQICRLLQRLFEGNGHQVRLAANGQEALKAIQESCPDLVLTDANMPVMNGIELLEKLSEIGRSPPIAILFSGCVTEQLRARALACGARAVLDKSAIGELLEEVERLAAAPQSPHSS